ncbi:MAG TPA: VOC family protein [Nitrolancea sp.]|nr:VOC family protein [Nitrolancea sp.]
MSGSFAAEFNPAVSHTALKVSDLEAALRFYRDTIGLPFVRSQGPEERPAVVWLRGLQLVRRTPEEIGERGALDHIGLGIDNIEAVCARVEQVGTPVETALEHRVLPGGQEVMVAFYRDPEGNRVELLKYL